MDLPKTRRILLYSEFQTMCKFQKFGCDEILTLNERQDHEIQCQFRLVLCPHYGQYHHFYHYFVLQKRINFFIFFISSLDCQAKDIRFVWSFIAEHYLTTHQGSIRFQDLHLENPAERFKVKLSPSSVIYYQGKILFVFIGKFKINQFPNCLKACLISTKREEDVKCTLTLIYKGTVL